MGQNGGKRPGAGRKSNAVKLLAAGFLAPFFGESEQQRHWKSLLASEDEKVRLESVKYLTDRLYGKAPQSLDLNHKGEVISRVVSDL